jgi:hypothetical protein
MATPITVESDCGSVVSFQPVTYPCRIHIQRSFYLLAADGCVSFERAAPAAAVRFATKRFGCARDVNVVVPCRTLDSVQWHGYFMRINERRQAEFVNERLPTPHTPTKRGE